MCANGCAHLKFELRFRFLDPKNLYFDIYDDWGVGGGGYTAYGGGDGGEGVGWGGGYTARHARQARHIYGPPAVGGGGG